MTAKEKLQKTIEEMRTHAWVLMETAKTPSGEPLMTLRRITSRNMAFSIQGWILDLEIILAELP